MKTITIIVGLPGSGKTFLIEKMLSRDPQLLVIDDPMKPDDLDWDEMSRRDHIVIADVNLCDSDIRQRAGDQILTRYPDCSIEWIFFENNPEECRRNVDRRADGRHVGPTIDRFSKVYQPPQGARIIPVYRGK